MANIRQLKEDNNQVFYPQTHEKAVIDSNGVALDVKLSGKQNIIQDLSEIRSGAALGSTSVQPMDIENMVEAEPIGSIIPPVNPSEFSTKEEVSQLRQEVNQLAGKFYGVFASSSLLPEGDAVGYAFVGSENPYAIWNYDGTDWSDSGSVANGITGEPGVGFSSIFTPQPYDGTMIIVLSNNDTITVDLNHQHPQYLKYSMLEDESDMPASPDSGTLYMWPLAQS